MSPTRSAVSQVLLVAATMVLHLSKCHRRLLVRGAPRVREESVLGWQRSTNAVAEVCLLLVSRFISVDEAGTKSVVEWDRPPVGTYNCLISPRGPTLIAAGKSGRFRVSSMIGFEHILEHRYMSDGHLRGPHWGQCSFPCIIPQETLWRYRACTIRLGGGE